MAGPPTLVCAVCAPGRRAVRALQGRVLLFAPVPEDALEGEPQAAVHPGGGARGVQHAVERLAAVGGGAARRPGRGARPRTARRGRQLPARKVVEGLLPTLFVAAELGHGQIVRDLLEASADKDLAAIDGATPLYVAVQNGHEEVVRALLDAGADRNSKTDDGCAPLHMAAEKGNPVIVRALLNAGAEPDSLRKNGCTPLFIAAQEGHTDVVCVFLGAGANKDLARTSGATPLHVAAAYGHAAVVSVLLDAGADKTAYSVAIRRSSWRRRPRSAISSAE